MQIIILKKDNLRKYYFSGDSKDAFYIKDFVEVSCVKKLPYYHG